MKKSFDIVIILLVFGTLLKPSQLFCQSNQSKPIEEAPTKINTSKFKKAKVKIEEGYNKRDEKLAADGYYDIGMEYYNKGDYKKSEDYFTKSKQLYSDEKNDEGISKSSRALAKVQEELNKNTEALGNYKIAVNSSSKLGDTSRFRMNGNDVGRLSNWANKNNSVGYNGTFYSVQQEKSIADNILLSKQTHDTVELISNYTQLANLNLSTNKMKSAVYNYSNAYQVSKQIPQQAISINQKIADIYVKNKDYDKAIETKKELLNESFVQNSTQTKASETNQLAAIYLEKKETSTALDLLKQSYNLSVQNGHTLEAKYSIEKLDSLYRLNGNKDLSLALYKSFLSDLPNIINKDSSLVDAKIILETEEKLKTLEEEKKLKDALIKKKNIFNYWLLGSMAVLLGLLGAILFIYRKLKINNKKIALQSLRREMNPHFIFNSLNSVNQFIANNNEVAANQYLTKFSTLMRRVMENSKDDFVPLSKELELLQHYLELEKSRFADKFDFTIKIDDELIGNEQLFIPGMLIQPYLENSIWHGLRYKEEKGFLTLNIKKQQQNLHITIEDNGVGIAASKAAKTVNQKKHNGRGMLDTLERIKILNELYQQKITTEIIDKPLPNTGVLVKLTIPVKNKNAYEN